MSRSSSTNTISHLLSAQVYCHTCAQVTTGKWHIQNSEYSCSICDNNFVEELGQDLEQFTSFTHGSTNTNSSSDDDTVLTSLNTIANAIPYSHSDFAGTSSANSHSIPYGNSRRVTAVINNDAETSLDLQQIVNRMLGSNTNNDNVFTVVRDSEYDAVDSPVGIIIRQGTAYQHVGTQALTHTGTESNANNQQTRHVLSLVQSLLSRSSNSVGSDEMSTAQLEQFLHHILMHENSHSGIPPASKEVLDGLTRRPITPDTDTSLLGECCITQENFEVGDVLIPLSCGHNYKQESIVHWLQMHNTCPVCRIEIS